MENDPLKMSRKLIAERFPGIDEHEAIAYARGFAKGMAVAGLKGEEAKTVAFAVSLKDKMLEAGGAWMQQNIVEAICAEKQ